MQIPWVQTFEEIRQKFVSVTDVVVMELYDTSTYNDEGEEMDPVDVSRVYVRTARVAKLISLHTGWNMDIEKSLEMGYSPAATFTRKDSPEAVQIKLEEFLAQEKIWRRGQWINTFQPLE